MSMHGDRIYNFSSYRVFLILSTENENYCRATVQSIEKDGTEYGPCIALINYCNIHHMICFCFNGEIRDEYSSFEIGWTGAVIECLNKFGSLGSIGRNLNVLPD